MRWGHGALATAASLAVAIGVAHADNATEAARLAAEGRVLGHQHKLTEALDRFRRAAQLDERPAYICNIGLAYYALDRLAPAYLFLDRCGSEASADVRPRGFDAVFAYVKKKLAAGSYVQVVVAVEPAAAQAHARVTAAPLADGASFPVPRTLYLPRGADFDFRAQADGYRPAQAGGVHVTADTPGATVTIPLEAIATTTPPAGDQHAPPAGDQHAPPPTLPVEHATGSPPALTPTSSTPSITGTATHHPGRWGRVLAWAAAGSAVVATGTGVLLYHHALTLRDDNFVNCDGPCFGSTSDYNQARTRVRKFEVGAWATWGLAAALAGASVYLFTRPVGDTEMRVSAVPTAGGGLVSVGWSR